MNSANIKQVCDLISKSSSPLILIPGNFDTDTICGAMGLYLFLKNNKKNPSIACSGDISEKFNFLGNQNIFLNKIEEDCSYKISFTLNDNRIKDLSYVQEENILKINLSTLGGELRLEKPRVDILKFNYDLVLVLGSPGLRFLGKIYSENACFFSLMGIINIDYHKENEYFGKVNLIKPNSSISEISADIAYTYMRDALDDRIADLFLTGIIARTNNFRSKKVRAKTFEVVSILLRTGASREEVLKRLAISSLIAEEKIEYYPPYKITKEIFDKISGESFGYLKEKKIKIGRFEGLKSLTLNQQIFYLAALLGTIQGVIILERAEPSEKQGYTIDKAIILEKNSEDYTEKKSLDRASIFMETTESVFPILDRSEQLLFRDEKNDISPNSQEKNIITSLGFEADSPSPSPSSSPSPVFSPAPSVSPEIIVEKNKNIISEKNSQKVGLPKKLSMPIFGITAAIQEVGLTSSGEMASPGNFSSVGWFKLGVRPGENGNAVIAGHLDTYTSNAGIFWNLNKLKAGDYVYVIDEYDKKLRFRVVKSELYDVESAPMEEIFGASSKARLNLVTCNGAWDFGKKSYDKRLVVFTDYDPE